MAQQLSGFDTVTLTMNDIDLDGQVDLLLANQQAHAIYLASNENQPFSKEALRFGANSNQPKQIEAIHTLSNSYILISDAQQSLQQFQFDEQKVTLDQYLNYGDNHNYNGIKHT